ncbi:hypothetical protein FTV88_1919 [Heliorestis convoluta]|uniref:Uncharacterized protein n=1 Tax=Heliorestis convoluta TaxID=356322 RepID=A0A5Q2MZB2_9FIRM|nr:hypothetical protein FTV88_1919 [Heliorestis convoluta]
MFFSILIIVLAVFTFFILQTTGKGGGIDGYWTIRLEQLYVM